MILLYVGVVRFLLLAFRTWRMILEFLYIDTGVHAWLERVGLEENLGKFFTFFNKNLWKKQGDKLKGFITFMNKPKYFSMTKITTSIDK